MDAHLDAPGDAHGIQRQACRARRQVIGNAELSFTSMEVFRPGVKAMSMVSASEMV